MKKIVVISHHAASLINFRGEWLEEMAKFGYIMICLAPDYNKHERTTIKNIGCHPVDYRLNRTSMNPINDLVDLFLLLSYLRRSAPDIVFCFSTKPVIYGTLAAWLARAKRRVALIEGAGYTLTESGSHKTISRKVLRFFIMTLYRQALSKANKVIFLNNDDRQEFITKRLVKKEKTDVLGGIGVNLEVWAQSEPTLAPVIYLFVGRLLVEKGIREFISAARLLKEDHDDVRFIILGGLDTNPGALTIEEVNSWVKEGIIEWPGHVNVKPWLKQASVFVLPSYREGVPKSTQEAMAVGRAVITTDVPGCRETIITGFNGYRIPPRDTKALYLAMQEFVIDRKKIISMGNASRKLAEKRFDVKKANARLTKLVMKED